MSLPSHLWNNPILNSVMIDLFIRDMFVYLGQLRI